MEQQIEELLETIRPRLALHGGGIEFIEWNETEKIVFVRFLGGCKGCPLSQITLKMGVEALLKEAIPRISSVEEVA